MKLTDIKISTRLGLLAAFLLLIVLFVGTLGWQSLAGNNARSEQALHNAMVLQSALNTARSAQVDFKIQVQEWKNILLRGNDPTVFSKYRDAFEKKAQDTQAEFQSLKAALTQLGLDTAQVDDTAGAHAELGRKYLDALKQYDPANLNSAHAVDKLVQGMDREPTKKIDEIVSHVLQQSARMMADSSAEANQRFQTAQWVLLASIVTAIALGGAAAVWLGRSITRPLHAAVDVARSVAAGDLRSRVTVDGKDETAMLLQALKDMNDSLARIVTDVRGGSEAITSASSQIASGNLDLSSRTETQASSLEETAASMEELTSTVKQNAESATQANALALLASDVATRGGAVVAQVVETMGSINASSQKIADIISVIDGIAFQTNILALNAAVEAARAGEQGRGFAVVAVEVRTLAQRSAAAAKEIKALIGDSVEKVGAGTQLADQAGATMNEVVASVQRVTGIIGEIAAASREQTSGIEQINQAITQMDDVTQQNAALVEEAAAAAASMQHQAANLADAVGVFKLADAR